LKDDKDKKETEQLQSNQVTKKESLTFSKMAAKKKLGTLPKAHQVFFTTAQWN